jgi:hypothetical protein
METASTLSWPPRATTSPYSGAGSSGFCVPCGEECIETMDANGGWISSAIMLVRFADTFNDFKNSRLLNEASIRTMLARPPGAPRMENGKPAESYYACGWQVRSVAERQGRYTKWHEGLLSRSSTLLVARHDGINWAAAFNCDADKADKGFAATIDPLLHQPADRIKDWPDDDLYKKYTP